MLELLAPVVGLGRIGKYLKDHQWIEKGVLLVIGKLFLIAYYYDIGIGKQAGVRHSNPHAVRVHVAWTPA
jgi:hypothetical protein